MTQCKELPRTAPVTAIRDTEYCQSYIVQPIDTQRACLITYHERLQQYIAGRRPGTRLEECHSPETRTALHTVYHMRQTDIARSRGLERITMRRKQKDAKGIVGRKPAPMSSRPVGSAIFDSG
ncbi:Hypothetical predicted protein [Pelobates cultripes]|uniref:Uncharacterized protein n=1 Tax=Pelobates cultripes TaxID=61616 RepID=A0AAD1RP80_PELCU|nr:Hypothetical predicted protein [Pelobates cultripes]